MASYTESLQDATLLANAHAQEGLVCLDCHELAVLEKVHGGADFGATELEKVQGGADFGATELEGRIFPKEFCFGCHVPNEHTSYEEIMARTEDYTVVEEKVNPHNPHAGSEEMGQEQFECYRCHSMHEKSRGINYCYGCHHERNFENCSMCH
jgi:hypothetical protein